MVEGMSVVVNVMLSQTSVMSPLPISCDLLVHTVVNISRTFIMGVVCLCVVMWSPLVSL